MRSIGRSLLLSVLLICGARAQQIAPDQVQCYTLARLNEFIALASFQNGLSACCSDCNPGTSPCATTATTPGSLAALEGGQWVCGFGSSVPSVANVPDFFDDFIVRTWVNRTDGLSNPFGWFLGNNGNCTSGSDAVWVQGDFNSALEFDVQAAIDSTNSCAREIALNDATNFFGTDFLASALVGNAGTFYQTRVKSVTGTLGDTTKDYLWQVGFGNFGTGAAMCVGSTACIDMYSQPTGAYAGRWTCRSGDSTGITQTDCGVSPSTSYQTLKIQAIAGPGWRCSVNGTACPDVTTHVTYGSINYVGPRVRFASLLNTERKKVDFDYVWVHQVTTR